MNKDIKSCPVCGSAAELMESYYLESERPYSYVHCTNQKCNMNHHNLDAMHFSGDNEVENSEKALAAWNERASIAA